MQAQAQAQEVERRNSISTPLTREAAAEIASAAMLGLDEFEVLLSSAPALHDLEQLHEWMCEVHAKFAFWASEEARLEAIYCRFYAALLDSGRISESTFKAIKHSSTMTDRYVAGRLPEVYEAWQRCKGLLGVCGKILDDLRTALATHRERSRIESNATL